jgi:hypothetical protein
MTAPAIQTIIVQAAYPQGNGLGVAGFVLSLLAVFLGWIPLFGWLLWLLGLIFSAIGLKKKPNGLAIAGLVISLVMLVLLIVTLIALFDWFPYDYLKNDGALTYYAPPLNAYGV